MSKLLISALIRAARSAIAVWVASTYAQNIWYAPVLLAVGKAIRDKFPGKADWLPI